MSDVNIKILVEERFVLDYESPKSLGIKFNRTVESFQDLSKRFGEFSYTFSLPQTKVNNEAFEWVTTKGRRGIFVGTQKTCRVYNNNKLLLDGVIELRSVKGDTLQCAFFSKFTQLLDVIGDKTLKDIKDETIGVWNDYTYEPDLRTHLNANYLSSDETAIQFPLVHYGTPWTPYGILNGASPDFKGASFLTPDVPYQNHYYLFGSDNNTGTNTWWNHQFPIAIYINKILEGILNDAGWSLGGSFFEREEIKKIIMLYTGDNDVYDKAIGCPDDMLDQCSGTSDNMVIKTFLPEMSQTDFMKGLMNTFNLYFTLDTDNKIIKFETWSVLFGDVYDPYDITEKVFRNTVNLSRIDNYDPTISFSTNPNERLLGDNLAMVTDEVNAAAVTYDASDEQYTTEVFNKIGTTGSIDIPFGLPQITRQVLRQDLDIAGSNKSAGDFDIFLPSLTDSTPTNDNNKPFYKTTGDTAIQNTEDTIEHKGLPTLMYYYGQSNSNIEQVSGTDNDRFYYVGIGSSPTRTKFGVASPFALVQGNDLINVNNYLNNNPIPKSKDCAEASYLKGLHYMLGTTVIQNGLPEYSLTFGKDDTFGDTLYTKFHKKKYDLYINSELLTATMRMNDVDWKEMSIARPIKYNNELYQIISIDNYDVVESIATLTLIKK